MDECSATTIVVCSPIYVATNYFTYFKNTFDRTKPVHVYTYSYSTLKTAFPHILSLDCLPVLMRRAEIKLPGPSKTILVGQVQI